ncbi:MAG: molybdenum-binding transcriptional regulator [Alphaproteobacteria bacterium]|jgi:molybdate transport system regulatory protein
MTQSPRLQLRLYFGTAMFGPGKARMLELIRDHGSISAAGRAMQMSYKRAWSLVEEMNAMSHTPLVDSARGGPGGGGATVTPTGLAALHHYRAIEALTASAAGSDLAALKALFTPDIPARK